MGKRNKKRIRAHEIPDDEMDMVEKPDVDNPPPLPRPPRLKVFQPRTDLPYAEGDVVTARGIVGTVFMVSGQEYHIVDSTGVIHRAYISEVTPIQS